MLSPSPPLKARWFDGASSQARPVLVSLLPAENAKQALPDLVLHLLSDAANASEQRIAGHFVSWPEAWSQQQKQRTLIVDLKSHGSLEVDDAKAWFASVQAAGGRPSWAQRLQTRWSMLLGVLLVASALVWAFYRYGTPWVAAQATQHIPLDWETALSERALQELDKQYLKPSQLPTERQLALQQGLKRLAQQLTPQLQRYPDYHPTYSLVFRHGLGANAFALPGGALVMTDDMVLRADKEKLGDHALLGVLAHEIGHVVHRHTTRMVVEQGVLNTGLSLALGDMSAIFSSGATLLTGLAYQRRHEDEADCFGVALMRQANLPTAPMADLLMSIEFDSDAMTKGSQKPEQTSAESGRAWSSLFSSHPDTAKRAQRLKAGLAGDCRAH